MIRENIDSCFIDRQSRRVSRHYVRFGEKDFVAVYDGVRKTVVTVLTLDMLSERDGIKIIVETPSPFKETYEDQILDEDP